jgi:hypothetical protein
MPPYAGGDAEYMAGGDAEYMAGGDAEYMAGGDAEYIGGGEDAKPCWCNSLASPTIIGPPG